MDKHYVDERVTELGSQIYELKREVSGLTQAVSMLSMKVDTKMNNVDVQQMIKQSEVIKKIKEA